MHDAFIAYRNSVEKSEGNADTWCSIGLVFSRKKHEQNQLILFASNEFTSNLGDSNVTSTQNLVIRQNPIEPVINCLKVHVK